MKSQRITEIEKLCAERGKSGVISHFFEDYHTAGRTIFAGLPQWEKTARAMAYAIENQAVYAYPEDRLGGRVYHTNELPVTCIDPEEHKNLIVRVGGYSARFVNLSEDLQNEIVNRLRHTG